MAIIYLYIDPASTSALVYIIVALVASALFAIRGFFYQFRNFILGKGFAGKQEFGNAEIVFYSEGKQYWPVFKPIIEALLKKGKEVVYLSSGKDDPGLQYENANFKCKYTGNLTYTSIYLNNLCSNFVGMTTPQLDVMMIRRSKHVRHYAHIVHAPIDIFTYRKFAFDYFDSVFCSGPHQIEGIRKLEQKRNQPAKLLLETGLTYYDEMLREIQQMPKVIKTKPIVLVAPTWKEYSIINRFGPKFFEFLLENDSYDVILRPHPQTYVSFPKLISEIEAQFKNHPRFTIDRNPLGTESMAKSDLMISDLSGVFWDYAFLFSKPVLLLKTDFGTIEGFEGSELDYTMWEFRNRSLLGREFDENDLPKISTIVLDLLKNPPLMQIRELRENSVYNFGFAGEIAANQIISIVEHKKTSNK